MGNVVSLRAFVVHVGVSVEMMLLSIQANLVFGPFDSKEEALDFCARLEGAHAQKHQVECIEAVEVFLGTGLPTAPYLDVHLGNCDIAEHAQARKEARSLIPPGVSELTEEKLGEYAVRAAFEATSYACQLLDDKATS